MVCLKMSVRWSSKRYFWIKCSLLRIRWNRISPRLVSSFPCTLFSSCAFPHYQFSNQGIFVVTRIVPTQITPVHVPKVLFRVRFIFSGEIHSPGIFWALSRRTRWLELWKIGAWRGTCYWRFSYFLLFFIHFPGEGRIEINHSLNLISFRPTRENFGKEVSVDLVKRILCRNFDGFDVSFQ